MITIRKQVFSNNLAQVSRLREFIIAISDRIEIAIMNLTMPVRDKLKFIIRRKRLNETKKTKEVL